MRQRKEKDKIKTKIKWGDVHTAQYGYCWSLYIVLYASVTFHAQFQHERKCFSVYTVYAIYEQSLHY